MSAADDAATDTTDATDALGALGARFSLAGRTALVTGASRGIGAEICAVFAEAGADIVASARDEAALDEVAARVRATGRRCTCVSAELAEPEAVARLADAALEAAGGTVDILVNNAGIARVAPALETTLEVWDEVMAVNVRAAFQLARALAPAMIAQRHGKIVNISSQAGTIGLDDHVAYSASKAAMDAMTRGLMVEWARHGVQVNAICPTVILTPMGREVWGPGPHTDAVLARMPCRRFGEPREVADLALYLASPASALVNGASVMIDGGFTAV